MHMTRPSIGELRFRLAGAARDSIAALAETSTLAGVALCTDDDLRTVFFVACSKEDCASADDPDFLYLPVEWELEPSQDFYVALSDDLSALADELPDVTVRRNLLFAVLVDALLGLRSSAAVGDEVLLVVMSTDPGKQLMRLAKVALKELNSAEAYRAFMDAEPW